MNKKSTFNNNFSSRGPLIFAHRGDSKNFPENTLSSFISAINKGADVIELDVQMSKDNIPVIIHDTTLDRTTSSSGPVSSRNFSYLKNLDNGSWKNPSYNKERIQSLEKILELLSSKILINIEIKVPIHSIQNLSYSCIEKIICILVNKFNCEDRVLISSFNLDLLTKIRNLNKKILLAPLFDNFLDSEKILKFLRKIDAFSCHIKAKLIDVNLLNVLSKNKIYCVGYTINNLDRYFSLSKLGISGIITDDLSILKNK